MSSAARRSRSVSYTHLLGAAEDDVAKALYPEAVRRGAVVVDNSHAFRLDEDVPLVIPERCV